MQGAPRSVDLGDVARKGHHRCFCLLGLEISSWVAGHRRFAELRVSAYFRAKTGTVAESVWVELKAN